MNFINHYIWNMPVRRNMKPKSKAKAPKATLSVRGNEKAVAALPNPLVSSDSNSLANQPLFSVSTDDFQQLMTATNLVTQSASQPASQSASQLNPQFTIQAVPQRATQSAEVVDNRMDDNGARPRKALHRHLPDLLFPMDSPSEMSESQGASSSNASECTNATEATIHTDAERLQARCLSVFATISDDDGDGHDEGRDGVGNECEDEFYEPLTSREQVVKEMAEEAERLKARRTQLEAKLAELERKLAAKKARGGKNKWKEAQNKVGSHKEKKRVSYPH